MVIGESDRPKPPTISAGSQLCVGSTAGEGCSGWSGEDGMGGAELGANGPRKSVETGSKRQKKLRSKRKDQYMNGAAKNEKLVDV